VILHAVGVAVGRIEAGIILIGLVRRIASDLLIAEIIVDRIQPEAVHAAVEPELHGLQHCILHRLAVEIEVGL